MASATARLRSIRTEVEETSTPLREAFQSAMPALEAALMADSLVTWADEGAGLMRRGPRYWDAAAEYFRASPAMADALTTRRLLSWARTGRTLAGPSGGLAAAFYRASPTVVQRVPTGGLAGWASMGQRLCTSADYADTLACRFFEASPRVLQTHPLGSLNHLSALLTAVAVRSLDLAMEVLNGSVRLLPHLTQTETGDFLSLGTRLTENNLNALRAYFDAAAALYVPLGSPDRAAFLDLIEGLGATSPRGLSTYLSEASRHLGPVITARGITPLALAAHIAGISPPAAREFIRNADQLADKLTDKQLAEWCRVGEVLLAAHEATGIGYFRLQSREALDALAVLSPIVDLKDVEDVLRLYCQALMGQRIAVVATEGMAGKSAGWAASQESEWEGPAVFAPARMQEFATKEGNFEAYKVLATHQAGHLEFGTFDFGFERAGELFAGIRGTIAQIQGHQRTFLTDFDRFFDLFSDRRLARDLFTIAEDTRVDQVLKTEYRGIRQPYHRVQQHAAGLRPDLRSLPLREQMVEVLIRMSLEQVSAYTVPAIIASSLQEAAGLVNLLRTRPVIAEDAAEATLRLYILLKGVPNQMPKDHAAVVSVTVDVSTVTYDLADEDADRLIRAFLDANQQEHDSSAEENKDDGEQEYKQPNPVAYRGELKPELTQALQRLQRQGRGNRGTEAGGGGMPDLSEDAMQEWLDSVFADWDYSEDGAFEDGLPGYIADGLMRSQRGQSTQGQRRGPHSEAPHIGEPEFELFTYDEWDFRAKAYRPQWCQLRERVLREAEGDFFGEALASHRTLVSGVRRQFEMLRPELLGKVKRLLDGEEFDLDAVVDARVERRARLTPSDKVYWRRNRVNRSVAVAVLLDMSLSTDERIERDAVRLAQEALTEHARRAANKRIIDLEREGLVLLVEALEQIGDTYGIYGFSGTGRDDVQFYVIKETDEPMSQRIRRRVDGIIPLHGTRMGPAIRHTITKLESVAAKTRILIVLSDGRPQDRDYGSQPWDPDLAPQTAPRAGDFGVMSGNRDSLMADEKEYAVHDTKQALNEAKAKNIIPYCISVDKQGHDYLKVMCGDIGYEVVSDIESLPRRLPSLYRRLTTR